MIQPSIKVDTSRFNAAFKRYMTVSKRSLAEICNKKAALVAAGGTRYTRRASRAVIQGELGRYVSVQSVNKRGQTTTKRKLELATRKGHSAPLAELIINKRRGRAGEPGLEGAAMARAVRKMVAGRLRSVGFVASGWLPAVRKLYAILQDKSGVRFDRGVKMYGQPKGNATPAKASFNPSASIENEVNKSHKLSGIIVEGVQRAINEEAASMEAYVAKKLGKDAAEFNRS